MHRRLGHHGRLGLRLLISKEDLGAASWRGKHARCGSACDVVANVLSLGPAVVVAVGSSSGLSSVLVGALSME